MTKLSPSAKPLTIAQISDCHLFADVNALHYGANVYLHLHQVVADIAQNQDIDMIIFTGDLSQDHSPQSYQHFVDIFQRSTIKIPVYYLAGNHDEPALMSKYLTEPTFNASKSISYKQWQIQLLDSKSATPAGEVSSTSLTTLKTFINEDKFQLLCMHHHPVDVGYFIDQHGLTNQAEFWQTINEIQHTTKNIKAIACGHVHRASLIAKQTGHSQQSVDVYTCPATSIAFDPSKKTVSSLNQKPSYRLFSLFDNGTIASDIIYPPTA